MSKSRTTIRNRASRPGRPRLPTAQRKSKTLCTRADARTYDMCRRAARAAGERLTEWMRMRLVDAARSDLTR